MNRQKLLSTIATTLLLAGALAAIACGGGEAGAASTATTPFEPPATRPGDDGWLLYVDVPMLDRTAAAGLTPGNGSPAAAVTHFYASRLRGDERYRDVLVPDGSARLHRALRELDEWTFQRVRLEGEKDSGRGSKWVKVWFEIEVDGDVDSGSDEVELWQDGEGWRIGSVPS